MRVTVVRTLTIKSLANSILRSFLLRYGFRTNFNFTDNIEAMGTHLKTDNFKSFTSEIFHQIFKSIGVQVVHSVAHRSTSNSVCERYIRSVQTLLRKVAAEHFNKLNELLVYISYSLNSMRRPHLQNMSPFEVLYGIPNSGILSDVVKHYTPELYEQNIDTEQLHTRLQYVHDIVCEVLPKVRSQKTDSYNKKHAIQRFKVGDQVLKREPVIDINKYSRKMANFYSGLYTVHELVGSSACIYIIIPSFPLFCQRYRGQDTSWVYEIDFKKIA